MHMFVAWLFLVYCRWSLNMLYTVIHKLEDVGHTFLDLQILPKMSLLWIVRYVNVL